MSKSPALKRPGLIVELSYSDDWFDVLRTHLDTAQIVDRRSALVTDQMGVEVKTFDCTSYQLMPDRFPVRVFYLGEWSEAPAPFASEARSLKEDISTGSRKVGSPEWLSTHSQLKYEDVWPGILQIRLRAAAGLAEDIDLSSCLATDATGVEVDLSQHDRIPEDWRFPLKLHFRAQLISTHFGSAITRQNLEELLDGAQPPVRRSSTASYGGSGGDSSDRASAEYRDHSTELQLESILPDVISHRLKCMGSVGSPSRGKQFTILLVDRIGVQVAMLGGIPDRSRFPLKFHVDDSDPGDTTGTSMTVRPTIREQVQKSGKFLRRGLSKLSGGNK